MNLPAGPYVDDDSTPTDPFRRARLAAEQFSKMTGIRSHDVAVILRTGLAEAAHGLAPSPSRHSLVSFTGFTRPVVSHQRSEVWSSAVGNRRVMTFLGRLHLYEGYSAAEVAHPVRMAAAAGCRIIVLTNASGSLDLRRRIGEVVLIADHLNLTGRSPLSGPFGATWPSPFVDLVESWSPRLRTLAKAIDPTLVEGVYAQLPGPHFETPAEIRMLRTLGADLVGMSSVIEAIAARQMGAEVLGLSLVTNLAAGITPEGISASSIVEVGANRAAEMGRLISELIPHL
jgi:purine-nucleoside phosphorylase